MLMLSGDVEAPVCGGWSAKTWRKLLSVIH